MMDVTVLTSALAMFYRSCLKCFIVLTPLAPTSTHSTHFHTTNTRAPIFYTCVPSLLFPSVSKQPPPQCTWSRLEITSRLSVQTLSSWTTPTATRTPKMQMPVSSLPATTSPALSAISTAVPQTCRRRNSS